MKLSIQKQLLSLAEGIYLITLTGSEGMQSSKVSVK